MLTQMKTALALLLLCALSASQALAATYPTLTLRNNYGEQTTNSVIGGSNQLDFNFVVASANGAGVTGLSGSGVTSVFMHTSTTPATGNPNPNAGYIIVNFAKPYSAYITGAYQLATANSGSSINVTTGVSAGLAYVITAVGTTTPAGFQALGLPATVTPAVGQVFIGAGTVTTTGTGTIQVPLATGSGADDIEIVGDPTASASNTAGAQVLLESFGATNSTTTTPVAKAIADGTKVFMHFVMR